MPTQTAELMHDLRMPLQVIYSCAQLLEEEVGGNARARGYVQALLSGRSLVESSAADNNLQLEDRLPSPALAAPARPVLDSLTGQVSAAPQTPQRRTGQEPLAPLRWTPAGPAVDIPAEQAPELEL